MPNTLYYTEMSTPVGPLLLAATERGLCRVEFGRFMEVRESVERWARRWLDVDRMEPDRNVLESAAAQIGQYFRGERRTFDLQLDLYGTDFQIRVWNALKTIPYGATRSYKQIGETIGRPRAVRAIGGANNRNPLSIVIPCHRVIGADGTLVGYGGGLPVKQYLLEWEKSIASRLGTGEEAG